MTTADTFSSWGRSPAAGGGKDRRGCPSGARRHQLEADDRDHLLERVAEMVLDVMSSNGLAPDDFISVIFTATSDLVAEFPAYAARRLGFGEVPLLCARELEIAGSMPRVVRMLAHVDTDLPRSEITHVYLHGAAALRKDLTRVRSVPDEEPTGEPSALRGPVLVVGAGLLGTSLGLALTRHGITVWLRDVSHRTCARRSGLGAGQIAPDIAPPPQLVVVAVPPDVIGETLRWALTHHQKPSSPTSAASRRDHWSSCGPTVSRGCPGTSAGIRWRVVRGPARWRPALRCSTGGRGRSRRTRTLSRGRRPRAGARAARRCDAGQAVARRARPGRRPDLAPAPPAREPGGRPARRGAAWPPRPVRAGRSGRDPGGSR